MNHRCKWNNRIKITQSLRLTKVDWGLFLFEKGCETMNHFAHFVWISMIVLGLYLTMITVARWAEEDSAEEKHGT